MTTRISEFGKQYQDLIAKIAAAEDTNEKAMYQQQLATLIEANYKRPA